MPDLILDIEPENKIIYEETTEGDFINLKIMASECDHVSLAIVNQFIAKYIAENPERARNMRLAILFAAIDRDKTPSILMKQILTEDPELIHAYTTNGKSLFLFAVWMDNLVTLDLLQIFGADPKQQSHETDGTSFMAPPGYDAPRTSMYRSKGFESLSYVIRGYLPIEVFQLRTWCTAHGGIPDVVEHLEAAIILRNSLDDQSRLLAFAWTGHKKQNKNLPIVKLLNADGDNQIKLRIKEMLYEPPPYLNGCKYINTLYYQLCSYKEKITYILKEKNVTEVDRVKYRERLEYFSVQEESVSKIREKLDR